MKCLDGFNSILILTEIRAMKLSMNRSREVEMLQFTLLIC